MSEMLVFVCSLLNDACSHIEKDYLTHEYSYLDKKYNINITAEKFDSLLKVTKADPKRIRNYNDSLSIVIYSEFDDYKEVVKAYNILKYSWQRAAYHVWLSEDQTKKVSGKARCSLIRNLRE